VAGGGGWRSGWLGSVLVGAVGCVLGAAARQVQRHTVQQPRETALEPFVVGGRWPPGGPGPPSGHRCRAAPGCAGSARSEAAPPGNRPLLWRCLGGWPLGRVPGRFEHELSPDARVPEEAPHLPPVQAAKHQPAEPHRHRTGDPTDDRGGEQSDRLRGAQPPGHAAVVRVQQDQPRDALRVLKCPVDHRWARGVVGHQHHRGELQVRDDGVEVGGLVAGGVGVADGLVGSSPAEESNVTTRRRASSGTSRSYRCWLSGKPCISTIAGSSPT
jgi:hypothetical protein